MAENWGISNDYWGTSATLTGALGTWTRSPAGGGTNYPENCPHQKYTFGYYNVISNDPANSALYSNLPAGIVVTTFPKNAVLSYSGTGYGTNHYGLRIRAEVLFIDRWSSDVSLIVTEGSPTKIDRFSFFYRMTDIIGEYFCGLNYHDYRDVMDDWFSHRSNTVSLAIKASKENYAWGISEVIIYKLLCDPSCLTCDGPS